EGERKCEARRSRGGPGVRRWASFKCPPCCRVCWRGPRRGSAHHHSATARLYTSLTVERSCPAGRARSHPCNRKPQGRAQIQPVAVIRRRWQQEEPREEELRRRVHVRIRVRIGTGSRPGV